MADSRIFELVAGELERATSLGRPAARAAVRAVLERALFDAETVNTAQMRLLVGRLLPPEIGKIGVEDAERVCRQIDAALASRALAADDPESPDEIFDRMIRR